MTVELTMLALSVVLGLCQILAAGYASNQQRGYRWNAGPRDGTPPPLTGVAGRLERAQRNFLETFPFFAALVLAVHLAGRHDGLTQWGAQLYFWARLAYVFLYAGGVSYLRSLVWTVATAGIVLLLIALFL
jgi:uncharacterized MAPEG superfamily protein